MNTRVLLAAAAAGIGVFVVTFAAVSEVTARYVEFSVFLGIPAGLLAGVAAAALVMSSARGGGSQALAAGLGAFGVVFLVTLLTLSGVAEASVATAMLVAAVVGLLAGAWAFVWRRRRGPTGTPRTT